MKRNINFFVKKQNFGFNSFINKQYKINPNMLKAEYSVRGEVVIKSNELRAEMENGVKMPFDKLTPMNIGNPQAVGQKPISFPREVISALYSGLDSTMYRADVVKRAETYKQEIENVEAYTHYKGMRIIREHIAEFIKKRDGFGDIDPEDILLTNGASNGIKIVLQTLIRDRIDTIMTPIPQYPLYSATIELFGGTLAGYYLKENEKWGACTGELGDVHQAYTKEGKSVKAIVVINPGNPTGNVLSKENIESIVKFAYDNNLLILADEVYQNNIYTQGKQFHSFRKVVTEMPAPYNKTILFSFNSVSKGYFGECGLRGGYLEMMNVPEELKEIIFKIKALEICPNLIGQIAMDLLVKPPTLEDSSDKTVEKYNCQVDKIQKDLKEKALILAEKLNSMKRIHCEEIEGAMYAFPRIEFPEHLIKEAEKQNMKPDLYYCLELLKSTGVMTVPGSGFGQEPGTYHFRLTNLITPNTELIKTLEKIDEFNEEFFKHH